MSNARFVHEFIKGIHEIGVDNIFPAKEKSRKNKAVAKKATAKAKTSVKKLKPRAV